MQLLLIKNKLLLNIIKKSSLYYSIMLTIKEILDDKNFKEDTLREISGWVRTVRDSSQNLGFCNINDGTNVNGLQIVISSDHMDEEQIKEFFKKVNTGVYLKCGGKLIVSPAKGQKYEMHLLYFQIVGEVDENYPLCKSKMNLDTLRNHIHLRARTNTFGSIFRIRSSLMKILHDFYHSKGYLHLDPNIITTNECEGGAGVFQVTEKDLSNIKSFPFTNDGNYDWSKDHFCSPVYLTVSSQLQLEAMACALGNVYTVNKSFRSEHSSTSKHVSEFTHLEIEIINNTFSELMDVGEEMIKFCISTLFLRNCEDIDNLNRFVSKGLKDRLLKIRDQKFIRKKYSEIVKEILDDIESKNLTYLDKLKYGDDLGSEHENYITEKYDSPVFVTHWPFKIKSFYMKQCEDNTCESFDLLMPHGIGELIGASQREDRYDHLLNAMKDKNVSLEHMQFYLDLRRFGFSSSWWIWFRF